MNHVVVLGAGAVGVAAATSIAHAKIAKRITLVDHDLAKAEGEALDLAHASPFLGDVTVDAAPLAECGGGDLCVITAGVKQRPGESRLELLSRNVSVMNAIAEGMERTRLPAVALVVTNPVDVMTEVLARRWESRPVSVLGSGTLLDTMRLRHTLARRFDVSPESVHGWVVGEHGDSSVCLLDSARIGGVPLADHAARRGASWGEVDRAEIVSGVRGAAYAIIERKGATCHAIGVAAARIARAIARDERVILPVTVRVAKGLSLGAPAAVGRHGARFDGMPEMSRDERQAFDASVEHVRRATELATRAAD
jgi:L-lactate dehydrogenase